MKKAFITGITGQDGAYLASALLAEGYHVTGSSRKLDDNFAWRLKSLNIFDVIDIRQINLTDQHEVEDLIRFEKYDEVYNLASQSSVALSWELPISTTMANSVAVLYLLEAIKLHSPETKLFQASSSEILGSVNESTFGDHSSFDPTNPYAVSKVYSHHMLNLYRQAFGLRFCSAILFNHESPLRGENFLTRKITTALAEIKMGSERILELGDLNAQRDLGYAPEYVHGIQSIMQASKPDDFELATGTLTSVRQFIDYTAEALDLRLEFHGSELNEVAIDRDTGKTVLQVNSKFYRPGDRGHRTSTDTKAKTILNWQPQTSTRELAHIMAKADYDRLQ